MSRKGFSNSLANSAWQVRILNSQCLDSLARCFGTSAIPRSCPRLSTESARGFDFKLCCLFCEGTDRTSVLILSMVISFFTIVLTLKIQVPPSSQSSSSWWVFRPCLVGTWPPCDSMSCSESGICPRQRLWLEPPAHTPAVAIFRATRR
jgi:hypothetical protein